MTQVKLLVDGMFAIDLSTFLPEKAHAPYTAASKSLLLISGKEKILVDTGIGDISKKPAYAELRKKVKISRRSGQGIKTQLAKHGLRMEDITTVVNTHLHIAHAGNNSLFKHAKFYIAGDEFRYVDKQLSEDPEQTAYVPEAFDKMTDVTRTNGEFQLTDDIRVIPTPGHTAGHQSVIVKHGGGSLVFCGDIAPTKENLVTRTPMYGYDRPLIVKYMDELLNNRGARWIFSHDGQQLNLRQAYRPN